MEDLQLRLTLTCRGRGEDYPHRTVILRQREKALIGRSTRRNDLKLTPGQHNVMFASPVVSRKHAEIYTDAKSVTIKDLGSMHGTYVNGARLGPEESKALREGDTIRVGRTFDQQKMTARTIVVRYCWEPISTPHKSLIGESGIPSPESPAVDPDTPFTGRTITVPESCDSDESDESEDDCEIVDQRAKQASVEEIVAGSSQTNPYVLDDDPVPSIARLAAGCDSQLGHRSFMDGLRPPRSSVSANVNDDPPDEPVSAPGPPLGKPWWMCSGSRAQPKSLSTVAVDVALDDDALGQRSSPNPRTPEQVQTSGLTIPTPRLATSPKVDCEEADSEPELDSESDQDSDCVEDHESLSSASEDIEDSAPALVSPDEDQYAVSGNEDHDAKDVACGTDDFCTAPTRTAANNDLSSPSVQDSQVQHKHEKATKISPMYVPPYDGSFPEAAAYGPAEQPRLAQDTLFYPSPAKRMPGGKTMPDVDTRATQNMHFYDPVRDTAPQFSWGGESHGPSMSSIPNYDLIFPPQYNSSRIWGMDDTTLQSQVIQCPSPTPCYDAIQLRPPFPPTLLPEHSTNDATGQRGTKRKVAVEELLNESAPTAKKQILVTEKGPTSTSSPLPTSDASDDGSEAPTSKRVKMEASNSNISTAKAFILGTLVGSVGILGALIGLPESLF